MARRTVMPASVRAVFAAEMVTARRPGPMSDRWRAAERAHIVSQPWAGPHTRTHAVMLRLAVAERDLVEVLGQIMRLALAGVGSAAGKYPSGNTGRTRAGLNTPMPLPGDLKVLLKSAGVPLQA